MHKSNKIIHRTNLWSQGSATASPRNVDLTRHRRLHNQVTLVCAAQGAGQFRDWLHKKQQW